MKQLTSVAASKLPVKCECVRGIINLPTLFGKSRTKLNLVMIVHFDRIFVQY